VRVEVEDTGSGMTPEAQQHVFDRFYRGAERDAEGFGLGLAIVRQAVLSMQGLVELDSAPGEGTRVRIVLGLLEAKGLIRRSGIGSYERVA
jgi:signal transduction histidine kinase